MHINKIALSSIHLYIENISENKLHMASSIQKKLCYNKYLHIIIIIAYIGIFVSACKH